MNYAILDELEAAGFNQIAGHKTPTTGEFIIQGTNNDPRYYAATEESSISAMNHGIRIKFLNATRSHSLYFISEDVSQYKNYWLGNDANNFRKDFQEALDTIGWYGQETIDQMNK